jgi:hypothetical protein
MINYEQEYNKLATAIRKHRDQRGDDRCWMDDYELYEALPEGINGADLRLNTPDEMLACCRQYIAKRHDPSKEYISPQRRIEELEKELENYRR